MAIYTLTDSNLKDKLVLDNTTAPKKFVFTDQTTYGSAGVDGVVPIAERYRVFRITLNGAVIYDTNFRTSTDVNDWNGASDSDLSAGDTLFDSVSLQTNTDGTLVNGSYKIEINTLFAQNDTGSPTYALVQSVIGFDVSYGKPTAVIDKSVDLALTPLITFTDDTKYIVDNVTPSIVRTLEYFDPFGNSVTSTSGSSIQSNTVYTGTCSAKLDSTITWDFSTKFDNSITSTYPSDNFTLNLKDSISKRVELSVGDDGNLCNVYCCVQELKETWEGFVAKGNTSQAELAYDKFQKAASLLSFAQFSVRCGRTSGLNDIILEIKELANCDDDCSCSDGSPQLIPDLGSTAANNLVTRFNTGEGSQKSFTGLNGLVGTFTRNNGSGFSTIEYATFLNKTFTDTKRDFDVFIEGIMDTVGVLDSSTGIYTCGFLVSTNTEVLIRFYD